MSGSGPCPYTGLSGWRRWLLVGSMNAIIGSAAGLTIFALAHSGVMDSTASQGMLGLACCWVMLGLGWGAGIRSERGEK